ncbi:MAG: hypothetical protein KKH94_03335 [Candidatus Omnitrophica bacterium]|nr:hypothetical protein [Candidatus Omnitrophota bacterium]
MPIKKIIMSQEMAEKIERQDKPIFTIAIPVGTAPAASGDYVLHEVTENYPDVILSASTSNVIAFVAQEGHKERMRLKGVKLHLGLSPSCDFEWEKE